MYLLLDPGWIKVRIRDKHSGSVILSTILTDIVSPSDPVDRVHVRGDGEELGAGLQAAALGQLPILATKLPVNVID